VVLVVVLVLFSTSTGDEGQAFHSAGDVPQGVEDAVRWDQRVSLTHHHTAQLRQNGPQLETETERERERQAGRDIYRLESTDWSPPSAECELY
jgi:hypothetical protein